MAYLLDTNIICEGVKAKPKAKVIEWFKQVPNSSIYVSILTIGEIRKGIEVLKDMKKKTKLLNWLEIDLENQLQGRVLDINKAIANKWGYLCAETQQTPSAVDSLIAATAITYNLKLVTRNEKDFKHFKGLELINPF